MPRPQIVVRPCHRIAEHLLVVGQTEREVLEQRGVQRFWKRALGDQSAPRGVARIERCDAGEMLLTHTGSDAVGADQHIALLCRTVREMRDHPLPALLDMPQLLAPMITRFRQCGLEQKEHAIPCRHGLRDRHAMRDAAVARKHHAARDLDAEVAVSLEPKLAQDRLQLRLRHDAGAPPGERLGNALVHVGAPAVLPQRERGEQPGHRAADHQRALARRQTHSSAK